MPDLQGAGRVLVVDDNIINRKQLARLLTDQGYSVTVAEDGRQAVVLLNSVDGRDANAARGGASPFDVILLDILMPEMDGYQVLEWVKSQQHLRHIPVIMISALDELESVVRCIESGAADFLPKPFKPALLQARLRASLAEKRLRDLELEYLEQASRVAEAALAVEAGRFDPATLDAVGAREDALGRLARVFQRMAAEVYLREQRLRQQLKQLRLDMEEMKRAQGESLAIYMPADRQRALAHGSTLPDRANGAALFADISGFTPLTGAFVQELGLERGAEELTRTINQVYTVLIDEVHRCGGSIIGFAGDAITCWFDDGAPTDQRPYASALAAIACGLAMQDAMALCNIVTTPGATTFELAVKVAIVAGPVRRFLVGDPSIQVIEAIAGQTLDRLAAAEHAAHRGEVVVQGELVEQLAGRFIVRDRRTDDRGRPLAVVGGPIEGAPLAPWSDLPAESLTDAQCRPWVLPFVYERAHSGHKQFLSELRPVSALFINFKGIDYDADQTAGTKLDAYVRWVQQVAQRYEAVFDHLTMGDKGSYICLAFGAPIAHTDDEMRAVHAALELLSPPAELAFIGALRIGVAAGQALVGTYGGKGRRTYGIQGDRVNLAARLMIAAPVGDILCDDEIYRAARGQVTFTPLPPIRVKGFAEPVAIYRPAPHLLSPSPDGNAHPGGGMWKARSRLDHLSPSEQLTLKVASVLGSTFTAPALREIFPVDSEKSRLDELLAGLVGQGLLTCGTTAATDSVYAFADGAVHHAAYSSMLFVQRRHLHRRAAEWYEGANRAELSPWYVILAHHWRHAGEPAKAVEYLEWAGRQAQAHGALDEAEQLFRASLELEAQSAVLSAAYYAPAESRAVGRGSAENAGPDSAGAIGYALSHLERELGSELTYHNLWHTVEDVLPAVRRLAGMSGISASDMQLLEVAAAYHDIGYVIDRQEHERAGAEVVAQVLPGFGFTSEQVAAVQGMILATRLPQSPRSPLEEILADADLDVLGREDSLARSQALRAELAAFGAPTDEIEWGRRQLKFFREHRYFTAAARNLREEGERRNIRTAEALLAGQAQDHVAAPGQPG